MVTVTRRQMRALIPALVFTMLLGSLTAQEAKFKQLNDNGLVCFEAENYSGMRESGGDTWWEAVTEPEEFSGIGGLQAMPAEYVEHKDINDALANVPVLEFTIDFISTKPVFVWGRASHLDGFDDSVLFGMDEAIEGTQPLSYTTEEQPFADTWYWLRFLMDGTTRAVLQVETAGDHVFELYMREPSFKIDKIVLTTNEDYLPDELDAMGPAETRTDTEVNSFQDLSPRAFRLSQNYPNPFNPVNWQIFIKHKERGKQAMHNRTQIRTAWLITSCIPCLMGLLLFANPVKAQPLATGHEKFLGCCIGYSIPETFADYFNQVTPENAGKWGSVEGSKNGYQWNGLDRVVDFALDQDFPVRLHVLVWAKQQPSWLGGLDAEQQRYEIEEWIQMAGDRYPDIEYVEVVNEPIERLPWDYYPEYYESIGGEGESGWDWIIWSFEMARDYFPDAKLYINDNEILGGAKSLSKYVEIIEDLKAKGLIDGICVQGHFLESDPIRMIQKRLDTLAETGLPIQISEFDVNIADDQDQLEEFQELFPVLWEHPSVEGITFWGYEQGKIWRENAYLLRSDGSERPALEWMRSYLEGTGIDVSPEAAPSKIRLVNNYPNPFNPVTTIEYELNTETDFELTILNLQGQKIRTLVQGSRSPGIHRIIWDAKDDSGNPVASGIYFCRLTTPEQTIRHHMVYLR